jgi:hypothetical protein
VDGAQTNEEDMLANQQGTQISGNLISSGKQRVPTLFRVLCERAGCIRFLFAYGIVLLSQDFVKQLL